MGYIQNFEDLLNFAKRRFWLITVLTVIGVILSAIYAKTRPDTYEAFAILEVQSAQVSGVEATASAQLIQSIEQRLTTRDNLQAVIDRHGLYADLTGLTPDKKLVLLRQNVTFVPIAAQGVNPFAGPAQISALVINARDGDAATSARIANDFAQGVLDMSLTGQMEKARDTVAFFQEEELRLSLQITNLESEMAEYKNANPLAVPGMAESLRDEINDLDSEIREIDQELVALSEEQKVLAAESNLRETDRRRLADLNSEVTVLDEQKNALLARKAEVDLQVAGLPEVEKTLAGYERKLDQLQSSLAVVSGRLAGAQTDAKLAERQQTERFAILDRAKDPEFPLGSGGKKLFVAGSIASLLFAAGLAFMLDLLKPVLRTSTQMERQLGIRPIVAIPTVSFPRLAHRK